VNAGLLLRALLDVLAAEGRMVLFSTHRFDMAARLCSRVLMLSLGRLVHEAAIADLPSPASEALEDLFVRVTQQADYRPLAREIFDAIAAG
jgi:ABC-2 type transport system ATP-binding protein